MTAEPQTITLTLTEPELRALAHFLEPQHVAAADALADWQRSPDIEEQKRAEMIAYWCHVIAAWAKVQNAAQEITP